MWSHQSYYPGTRPDLDIVRLAPGDGCLSLEWRCYRPGLANMQVRLYALTGGSSFLLGMLLRRRYRSVPTLAARAGFRCTLAASAASGGVQTQFDGLTNGTLYAVQLCADGVSSRIRLAVPCDVPGAVVNYIHPFDPAYGFSGRFTCSPSLLRLADGSLLASHDVYARAGGQNLTKIFRSRDGGASWQYVTDIFPCFWGKLFAKGNTLYLLGTKTEYGALLLGTSTDGGESWSDPMTLHKGGSRAKGGPHRAPMQLTEQDGRIWTALEHGSWQRGGHATGVVSAPLDADWSRAESWTVSGFLPYDKSWPGTVRGGRPSLLEGNVLPTPSGGLVNLLRYETKLATPNYGKAIYLNIDTTHPEKAPTFGSAIDFEGNLSKFSVLYDAKSAAYYALANRVTKGQPLKQRSVLSLCVSRDLHHWQTAADLLDARSLSAEKVAFQYPDFLIADDDLLVLSRTAWDHADNFHNANFVTFHRVAAFRGCRAKA